MDNVALLKSVHEAFGRGDIPTVLGTMSPDIRWYEAEGNPYMPRGEAWVTRFQQYVDTAKLHDVMAAK